MEICDDALARFSVEMSQLMNGGKTEEAILLIKRKIDEFPLSDSLHYLLGNAYRKLSNWQMALQHYGEAMELNPNSPAAQAKAMLMDILNYRCKDLLNP